MRVFRRLMIPLLFAFALIVLPVPGNAFVAVSVTLAPPLLPVYVQPAIPGPGYIWVPGYWAWGPYGYYWVPGTWVLPPEIGLLWTPGYWWWNDGIYAWHAGYWGSHVGFYGGVNYGFGYTGAGYAGGYWDHGTFHYNTAVNNLGGVHIATVYNKSITNATASHVSYNGGQGGLTARANAQEQTAEHDPHVQPTALQAQQEHAASTNHALLASVNHGHPAIAATPRPGAFAAATHNAATMHAPMQPAPRPNVLHNAAMPHSPMHPAAIHPTGGSNAAPNGSRPQARRAPNAAPHPQLSRAPVVVPHPAGGPPHPQISRTPSPEPHPAGGPPADERHE